MHGNISQFAINPFIFNKIPYETLRDFVPLSLVASAPQLLVVNPGVAAKSVKELIDLARAKQAFEAVPWVRQAVVRREFPNRIKVVLQEHRAVAFWGAEGDSKMLNNFGEVFEANVGEVENEALPRLSGPTGQEPQVLAMAGLLAPQFELLDLQLEQLELTGRGSWIARLDNGAAVELGRGSDADVVERTARFLRTLTQVTSRYKRRPDAVDSADLRHPDGYALRLRGVSTLAAAGQKN